MKKICAFIILPLLLIATCFTLSACSGSSAKTARDSNVGRSMQVIESVDSNSKVDLAYNK